MPNWRGICVMSLAAKRLQPLDFNRIRSPIDAILRKNQAGFRTGSSCIKQIYILRRIMDGAFSLNIPLFITIVDFKKAFDSIGRNMMFVIVQHYKFLTRLSRRFEFYTIRFGIRTAIRTFLRTVSRTAIRTICYDHRSVTRWCISTITIHHLDRLCFQKICWRFQLTPKGSNQDNSGRAVRSTSRISDYK